MCRLSLLLLSLIAFMASCSSDEPQQPTPVNRVDIVTLECNNPVARLILDAPDASGVKVLFASEPLRGEIENGSRLLIDYDAALADTARKEIPIKVNGFSKILSTDIKPMPHEEVLALAAGEVTIISQWRTDQWLNVQLSAAYSGTQRAIAVAADESTLGDAVVNCYIYNPGEPVGPNSVNRKVYASFFIEDLDLRPDQKVEISVK